jgi:hypothetical protein
VPIGDGDTPSFPFGSWGFFAVVGAAMAMIALSSPATLTGAEEKKTGPSRFRPDFLTELTKLSKFRNYKRAYTQ